MSSQDFDSYGQKCNPMSGGERFPLPKVHCKQSIIVGARPAGCPLARVPGGSPPPPPERIGVTPLYQRFTNRTGRSTFDQALTPARG